MSSAGDISTMCSNMNIISCTNAKTTNVLDNLNSCKEFVTMETDAFVVTGMMKYFGMNDINTPAQSFIPPDILNADGQQQKIWLNRHIKAMLETFSMNDQQSIHERIRSDVQAANTPQPLQCKICQKSYKYPKARANHEIKIHGITLQPSTIQHQSDPECEHNITDERFEYACARLSFGLFVANFDDAIKEGDGERIIRCWKFALLIFKAYNHSKYALASLLLQAGLKAMLTPRQAHCLMWNRTVNTKGGRGKNISLDLRLEHLNNIVKGMLKNLGPNIRSERCAARCCLAVGKLETLIDVLDTDLGVKKPTGQHISKKSQDDFKALVDELHTRVHVFESIPGRKYQHFPGFSGNILSKLNFRLLNNWITTHKKELQKLE